MISYFFICFAIIFNVFVIFIFFKYFFIILALAQSMTDELPSDGVPKPDE